MNTAGVRATIARTWDQIPVREPWRVLGPLLLVHWIALVVFTTRVHHNAWLFYQGGDQIWYWTTGWLLGHGSIMDSFVTHGWSTILVPFTWIGGAGFLGGLAVRPAPPGARAGAARSLVHVRARRAHRRARRRLPRGGSLDARAVSRRPALRPPLPRSLRRPVPAPAARPDGDGGLRGDRLHPRLGRLHAPCDREPRPERRRRSPG